MFGGWPSTEGLGTNLWGAPYAHCKLRWSHRLEERITEVMGGNGSWEKRPKKIFKHLLSW